MIITKNKFPDPDRTASQYDSSIGGDGTREGFIGRTKQQSKRSWARAYTAAALNNYFRAGFGIK